MLTVALARNDHPSQPAIQRVTPQSVPVLQVPPAREVSLYDKIKEDVKFRRELAEKCGFGFELPSVVTMVPKTEEFGEAKKAA